MASRLRELLQRILGKFFELLYTHLAFSYDMIAWLSSMGQWRDWRNTAILDYDPGTILELGHGPGHLLLELKKIGVSVIGLDPSRQMNRLAQQKLRRSDFTPEIVRGKAQALPFADKSVSAVVSTFPSNYIIDPTTLSEVGRVLPGGGLLVIIGLIQITGKSLPDRFSRWLYAITGQSGSTPPGWDDYLARHGFEVRLEDVDLGRSIITRIIATRKG